MLSVHTGHDTDYLTDAVAKGREGYYTGAVVAGEPPGLWYGRAAEELGLSGQVDAEVMKALFTHGVDPRDPASRNRATWHEAARLGNPPRNYQKADDLYTALVDAHPAAGPEQRAEFRRQAAASARQSVAFYDVTYSAPKSMTVLWVACERAANDARAAGDLDAAELWAWRAGQVEEAVLVGHRAMLDFYAEQAGYARAGHHGGGAGQWVDGNGLVAAQFLQHDSRDKDPQLHAHGPILNRIECKDGKWRAIDGSLIYQWKGGAGAVGDRTAEAHLWQNLDVWWEVRPDGKAREIVGVDPDSSGLFSKRVQAIGPVYESLAARFRAETGRDPSGIERARLREQATLATRQGKSYGGETRDGQIARWAAEHSAKLGKELTATGEAVFARPPGQPALWSERDVVERALASFAEGKQAWSRSDLMRAVSDALPGHLGIGPDRIPALLEGLTDKAEQVAQLLNPAASDVDLGEGYRRADGSSVFVKPGAARYATTTQLLGEAELRAAAVRRGAPTLTDAEADEVLARFARSGRVLGPDQAAALRGILTSGAAVEVLSAPAGTGKSFLVGTLAETWTQTGRTGLPAEVDPDGLGIALGHEAGGGLGRRVFGVAYGQRQAEVLAEEGVTARNIRAWLDGQARLDAGTATGRDEVFRLRRGDLLVVDEAGAAPTPDLVAIHRRCDELGVKLLLVGDPKQIGGAGPSGALGDIAAHGITYDLAEVRRFRNDWEGPASLRLRDGDTSVVAEYAKHGRIVDAGTLEQAEAAASRAWLADTLDGHESLLMVGTNDAAARVSANLRADLVRLGLVDEAGVALGMQGTTAGVGDLVQARRNAWHLAGWAGNTEAPINRTTYRVLAVHPDGRGLTVARVTGRDADGAEQLAEPMQLPGSYVHERVALAYASTVNAAHGRTVYSGYPVLGPGTDAASGYVQYTRGTHTNIGFVVTRAVAEGAEPGETQSVIRRSGVDVVTDMIRPPEQEANRTALREAEDAALRAASTTAHVDPLVAVVGDVLAGRTAGWLDELAATGELPERHRLALAADDATDTVDRLLRAAELAGHDPEQVLKTAIVGRSLDGSTSTAQVLHHRIRHALPDRLDPQVSSYADLIPRHVPEQLRGGLHMLAEAADDRRRELGAALAQEAPQWACEALGPVPDEPVARAEWEHKAGWAGSYREWADHTDPADPLGAAPPGGLAEKHAVFGAAHAALDLPTAGAEEETLTEGQLRNRVAAWERELRWAPHYVADQLEATYTELRRHQTDATVWAARAVAEPDLLERDQLTAAAEAARRAAEELAPLVAQLDAADTARTAWWVHTAVTRDKAERSRYAAGWRGIDLDAPTEQVTAQEWTDAHELEQLLADADREVREDYELRDTAAEAGDEHGDADGPADKVAGPVAAGPGIEDAGPDQDADDPRQAEEVAEVTVPSGSVDTRHDDEAVTEPARWSLEDEDDGPARDDTDPDAEQDRTGQDRTGQDRTGQDRTGQDRTGQDRTGQDRTGQDRTEQDRTEQDRTKAVETAVPDLREVSEPDAGERDDTRQRRRVPTRDETAETVDRAHLAVAEVQARRDTDRAADTAREEPERREELARWAAQDAAETADTATDTSGAGDADGDDMVIER